MWWTTIIQSVVSLGVLAAVGATAFEHRDPFHVAWACGIAIPIAGVWLFLLLNRRGVWAPYAETTQSFVMLVAERGRRRLRVIWALSAMAVVHVVFTAWLAWWGFRLRPGQPLHPADAAAYLGAVAALITVLVWAAWYRRRTIREIAQVREIAALVESPAGP
jgi:hypothetical protein